MSMNRIFILAVSAAALFILNACAPSDSSPKATGAKIAFMDDANLGIFVDVGAMNSSAFYQATEQFKSDPMEQMPEELKKLQTILGIEEKDVREFALFIKDITALMDESWDTFAFTGAISVAKKVDDAQLETVLITGAEQDPDAPFARFRKEPYKQGTLFINESGDVPFPLVLALISAESSVFIIGNETSVKQALDRASAGKSASGGVLSSATSAQLESQQGWFMVNLPQQAQDELKGMSGDPQMAMFMGPAASALGSLTQLGMSMTCDNALNFQLFGALGSAEDAKSVKGLLDNMLGGMGKMMSQQQFGKVLNVLEVMNTTTENNTVRFTTALTVDDVTTMNQQQ